MVNLSDGCPLCGDFGSCNNLRWVKRSTSHLCGARLTGHEQSLGLRVLCVCVGVLGSVGTDNVL